MNEFGQRLLVYRRRAGLSQKQLALQMGLSSHAAIGGWERGENYPSYENLGSLRQVLQVSVDELMFGSASKALWARQMAHIYYPKASQVPKFGGTAELNPALDRLLGVAQGLAPPVVNAVTALLEVLPSIPEKSQGGTG